MKLVVARLKLFFRKVKDNKGYFLERIIVGVMLICTEIILYKFTIQLPRIEAMGLFLVVVMIFLIMDIMIERIYHQ